jgi:hypothetical protein
MDNSSTKVIVETPVVPSTETPVETPTVPSTETSSETPVESTETPVETPTVPSTETPTVPSTESLNTITEEPSSLNIYVNEFNNNFTTVIYNIIQPPSVTINSNVVSIAFDIICKNNNRTNFFQYDITDADILSSNATCKLVDYAWSNLCSNINLWASDIINSNTLINTTYTPTVDFSENTGITLDTYNSNYNTTINSIYVYPQQEPKSWIVGYTITNNINNRRYNINSAINVETFELPYYDIDLLNDGWLIVKDEIGKWALNNLQDSPLIGTIYTPGLI